MNNVTENKAFKGEQKTRLTSVVKINVGAAELKLK